MQKRAIYVSVYIEIMLSLQNQNRRGKDYFIKVSRFVNNSFGSSFGKHDVL